MAGQAVQEERQVEVVQALETKDQLRPITDAGGRCLEAMLQRQGPSRDANEKVAENIGNREQYEVN